MDRYYWNENILILKRWVYYQIKKHPEIELQLHDERTYLLIYKNKKARFVVWPQGYVEEAIIQNNQLMFYLHYQFHDFKYATDLFERMLDKILEDTNHVDINVLLCCSSGLTTGYFAQRANQFCELNQLPYKIDAVGVDEIPYLDKDYSIVLFAPQVQYQINHIKDTIKVKYALIDPTTFATYDCAKLIKTVDQCIKAA